MTTQQGSGTQTAVIGTEHTLLDVVVSGSFLLEVDKVNMLSGDTVELRIYAIVITGGTRRVAYKQSFTGAAGADDLIAVSVPISNALTDAGAVRFTLKQTAGTGRSFDWSVLKL